ncbi:serine/threonine protein kinase [Cohnella thermotolerans]|uniref:serine/threonine protein kinase n=1 Tax=Cohnella thermotolerans TaxID=329858 RepID=UPI00040BFC68|nr:serine/threonine-protein kinase [Cohnella thermotolerans]
MKGWKEPAGDVYRTEPGCLLAGRYRIVGPIGQGGMGSVHLAEDVRLAGKLRAVKLTKALPEEREAFIAEARLLSRLEHPHLPQIVDYFPPDRNGTACIVMEYVAGESLGARWLQAGGRMPFSRWLKYMLDLCDVLRYLHAQEPPVVFRDLKPANVLIDASDRAILVDFGIARLYRKDASADTLRLGTPGFAAPEQLRGEQSDARTDLYGLGALAYYLLTGGSFAYRRSGRAKLDRDVPPLFEELLERLLSDRPEHRPSGAAELYEELRALADSERGRPLAGDRDRLPQPYGPDDAGRPTAGGATIAAFVSAYPGAGATFVALALSARLAELEVPHALVECPGGEAELYSVLDGERNMPPRSVFADPSGVRPSSPAWRSGTAAYYPLNPEAAPLRAPENTFADWLARLGPSLVLLDVSSGWETPGVAEWVGRNAGAIYFVADCLPSRWNGRRQRASVRMEEEARRRGADAGWIANRDHDFPARADWLALFPRQPQLEVPDIPIGEVSRMLWKGGPFAFGERLAAKLDRFIRREWMRR